MRGVGSWVRVVIRARWTQRRRGHRWRGRRRERAARHGQKVEPVIIQKVGPDQQSNGGGEVGGRKSVHQGGGRGEATTGGEEGGVHDTSQQDSEGGSSGMIGNQGL